MNRITLFIKKNWSLSCFYLGMKILAISAFIIFGLSQFVTIKSSASEDNFRNVQIISNDKCLDVPRGSLENLENLLNYSCHDGKNQIFTLIPDEKEDTYFIQNALSLKCLDIPAASKKLKERLIQFSCGFGHNQKFQIIRESTEKFKIKALSNDLNLCLKIDDQNFLIQDECESATTFNIKDYSLDFSSLNPKEKLSPNPTEQFKYRGMSEVQFSFENALAAILDLDFEKKTIPSKFYSCTEKLLKNDNCSVLGMDESYDLITKTKLLIKLSDHYKKISAKKLSNIVIEQNLSLTTAYSRFLDRQSLVYEDYSSLLVYTSFFRNIAELYSENISIIHEEEPKGVDLNYLQFKKKNTSDWFIPNDIGEYVILNEVPSHDVAGIYIPNTQEALIKFSYKNETYALLVSTKNNRCLRYTYYNGLLVPEYCEDKYAPQAFPELPARIKDDSKKLIVKSILKNAKTSTTSNVPVEFQSFFKIEGNSEAIKKIHKMKIHSQLKIISQ